jgi:hypothetical protein
VCTIIHITTVCTIIRDGDAQLYTSSPPLYAPSSASPSRMHHHLHHVCTIISNTYAPSPMHHAVVMRMMVHT